ncbi:MAG: oligosaccharide flippase family protein [Cyclobacteriaceae bacterium]|nr:oligosaccharide flippase family protein [Cyclobacteriaceae bacterium]
MTTSKGSQKWINSGVFALLYQGSVVIFGFASIFLLVRMMPPSEIGIWVLYTSVGGIMEALRNGFIRNALVSKLVVADQSEKSKVVHNSLILHVLLTLLIVIILVSTAEMLAEFWFAKDIEQLFYVYAGHSIVLIAFLHFEFFLHSTMDFRAIFITNFIRLFIFLVYIFGYYISGNSPSLIELAIIQLCSTGVASIFSYQLLKTKIPSFQLNHFDVNILKKLFHLGKYTFGTTISSMLIKNTDSWMIGRLISTEGVAIYNPALRISNIVEVPTLAIANIVFPQIGNKMRESGVEGVQTIYYKSISLLLAVMLPAVLLIYILADIIILAIFGYEYMESVPILQVAVFYTLLVPFSRQFGTIMEALYMNKLNFYLSLLIAGINVVLNYFLLQSFGVIGAAYSTVISYCIIFIIYQIILYYKFKINIWTVLVEVIAWYVYGWRLLRKWIS